MATTSSNKIIVGAIDFGTTYSGYAFSTLDDFQRNPLEIHCKNWPGSDHVSQKAPTWVLFKPDKSFHSFGYEAEDKYCALMEEEEEDYKKWYFFRRFKMMLYNQKSIDRSIAIKDINGREMIALDVFAACIRFLKDDLCGRCKDMRLDYVETDVEFVLTVPAIWDAPAKFFMREAALRAGIPDGQLKLVLEPEAASVYCRHLPDIDIPKKYIVLDSGGGTSDIAVHEVIGDGRLRELHKSNGGDWGGTKVDDAFSDLLKDVLGEKTLEVFRTEYQEDWFTLFRSFEVKKRRVSKFSHEKVTFLVPTALSELGCKFSDKEQIQDVVSTNQKYKSQINLQRDKLRVDALLVQQLFNTSVSKLLSHLTILLEMPILQDVKCIIMVGGFCESLMLQGAIKAEFERRQIQIVIPPDAELSVLKGAVISGHKPSVMLSRICRYTYGLSCSIPFIEGKHPEEKKIEEKDGTYNCNGIFAKLVEEGTVISEDDTFTKCLTPRIADQKSVFTRIIASTERNITYVTDPGAIILGKLSIEMPDTSRGLDRKVFFEIKFGDTELKVTAKDRDSDRKVEAKFDFLSNSI